MPERAYSKRELDQKFDSLEEKFEASSKSSQEKNDAWNSTIVKQNEEILKQVKYTNGRVRKLEGWRLYLAGGMTILSVIVLPAVGYLATQILHSSEDISALRGQVDIIIKNVSRSTLP